MALLITDGVRLAADPEPADGEVVGGLEADRDRAGEHVALLLGVLPQLSVSSLTSARVVRREAVEVGLGQLDVEVVGHHPALAGQDLRVVVALALQRRGDLDGLDGAAEGPGEGSGDQLLEALLEPSAARSRRASSPLVCSRSRHAVVRPSRPGGTRPDAWSGCADRIGAEWPSAAATHGRCEPADRRPVWGASSALG